MKCYYEILGVERDVNNDDLKKAYKKLALKWHPDKNVENELEAKENFQLVQQAYEVLIDPHERAWYDNHREAILKGGLGGDYKDDSLDVLPFFSASCYKGFDDDPKGFYAVYDEVFKKLAAEDSEYLENDFEIPVFGKSDSSYEEVVAPFYSYWMYYSTKKSYCWLDPHDIKQAPNHKIAKLIEKENKKVRDKAKKKRNEEVRNLVAFVRKRDKRVQAWNKLLEDKARENQKKSEENRLQKLEERRKQMRDYKESEWTKFSNVENDLKQIEENLTKEFGNDESDSEADDPEYILNNSSLFCVACNKVFKTEKSFANHENSKKHKENILHLKETIHKENLDFNLTSAENETSVLQEDDNIELENSNNKDKKLKKKSKQKKSKSIYIAENSDSDSSNFFDQILNDQGRTLKNKNIVNSKDIDDDKEIIEKKGKRKTKKQNENLVKIQGNENIEQCCDDIEKIMNTLTVSNSNSENKEQANMLQSNKKQKKLVDQKNIKQINNNLVCAVCSSEFPSKNKLFTHLKSTGHAIYLPNSATATKKKEKKYNKNEK